MDHAPDARSAQTPSRLSALVLSHLYPSPEAPGRGSFVRDQCRALAEHCDVTVVTGRWGATSSTETADGPVRVVSVPLRSSARLPSQARVVAAIPGYTRAALDVMHALDTPPDLIHANFAMPDGVAAVRAGARADIPVVVTLLGSDFNRQMSRRFSGPFVVRSIGRADAVIAVSRQIADGLAAREPGLADRIEFIPNGYDSGLFHYEPKPAQGDFLFVGSFTPVKNPLVLVRAFGLIASRTSRDLVMIGQGHLGPEIERTVAELGLGDRVRLPGRVPVEQLRSYFRDAGVFVLPSATEGMPLVVIESLATGTPVVGSAVGAIPDLVVPGASGYLVEPGDVEGLAEALLEAERTAWDHAAIANGARVIDWAENARRVMAVYRRVVDRRRNAG